MEIKFFKKKNSFRKRQKWWFNFNFYWELAVGILFVAVVSLAVFGYLFFMEINKEIAAKEPSAAEQVQTVKKERIDNVLEYFSVKQQKSDQILDFSFSAVDPSL